MDLIGQNLSDFTDSDDYAELMGSDQEREEAGAQQLILRMKTVLTPHGRNLSLKLAVYKVWVNPRLTSFFDLATEKCTGI